MPNKVKKNKGLDDFQVIDVLLKQSQDAVEIYTFREVIESNPESFDCMHKHENIYDYVDKKWAWHPLY